MRLCGLITTPNGVEMFFFILNFKYILKSAASRIGT